METNKNKIVWGIIGCGDVAEIKSGPAFQKCEQSELLAVMRRDGAKAKDFAARHNVPLWYDDAQLLLENKSINAVYIATPPSTHLQYALEALKAGKDVYLEKPMTISASEALLLQEAVNASNNKLVVAHYRRQLPLFLKIKEILESNAIGDVKCIDVKYLKSFEKEADTNWRLDPSISGGGIFEDIAPHQIDIMYYYFGEYSSVKGISVNQQPNYLVSDTVSGLINFKNNIQFRGLWAFEVSQFAEEDTCTIIGTEGTISFSFFGNEVTMVSNNGTITHTYQRPMHIQQHFIQEVVNYFLGKRPNPCSVEEGVVVIEIMDSFTKRV